jgi:hypothetical protein
MFELNGDVIYQCEGCGHNDSGQCNVWLCPEAKFHGQADCGISTHITKMAKIQEEKMRVGQQKQKKKTRGK